MPDSRRAGLEVSRPVLDASFPFISLLNFAFFPPRLSVFTAGPWQRFHGRRLLDVPRGHQDKDLCFIVDISLLTLGGRRKEIILFINLLPLPELAVNLRRMISVFGPGAVPLFWSLRRFYRARSVESHV